MFTINGRHWDIVFVRPLSENLRRSDGSITVGVTDGNVNKVYLSSALHGPFLRRVMAHELCHVFCMSYDVVMPIEQEEFLADWISLYGTELIYLLDNLMSVILRKTA